VECVIVREGAVGDEKLVVGLEVAFGLGVGVVVPRLLQLVLVVEDLLEQGGQYDAGSCQTK
jgi:hypothetical protein